MTHSGVYDLDGKPVLNSYGTLKELTPANLKAVKAHERNKRAADRPSKQATEKRAAAKQAYLLKLVRAIRDIGSEDEAVQKLQDSLWELENL